MIVLNDKELNLEKGKQLKFLNDLQPEDCLIVTDAKEYMKLMSAIRKRYPTASTGKYENVYHIKILSPEDFKNVRRVFKKNDYIKRLKLHDWWYDYSDDHSVYTKGNEARNKLIKLQEDIDTDFQIWNQYCPKEKVRHAPVVGGDGKVKYTWKFPI
tara:strand:+ start:14058 stop:14525 length:468 start_codon:yes stop_codon:yes gene_type:complete